MFRKIFGYIQIYIFDIFDKAFTQFVSLQIGEDAQNVLHQDSYKNKCTSFRRDRIHHHDANYVEVDHLRGLVK